MDGAIAAPSANRSNRISPTTADHVRQELGDRVDLILDGGPCRVGIESTVLDLSGQTPAILRPGSVTQARIESVIGPVRLFAGSIDPTLAAISPGQHAIHYAPRAAAYRFRRDEIDAMKNLCRATALESRAALCLGPADGFTDILRHLGFSELLLVATDSTPDDYGRQMYAALRKLDVPQVRTILVETPPDEPRWQAVRDRLTRATRPLDQWRPSE